MIRTRFLRIIAGIAGAVLTLISCRLTYLYGLTISQEMAIVLALVSFMAGYIWPIALEIVENAGSWRKVMIGACTAIVASVTVADVVTNASTVGYSKTVDVVNADENNAAVSLARQEVDTADQSVRDYEKLVKELEAANPWLATVTADGLRDQIRNLEGDRIYARSRQCANVTLPESRQFCDGLTKLRTQYAAAQKRSEAQEKLDEARHVLSRKREVAMIKPNIVSAVAISNEKLAGILTVSRKPSETAVYWTDTFLMIWFGLLLTIASQFFNFAAWAGKVTSLQNTPLAMFGAKADAESETNKAVESLRATARDMQEALKRNFASASEKLDSLSDGRLAGLKEKLSTEPQRSTSESVHIVERKQDDPEMARLVLAALGKYRRKAAA